jgi:hypothetical protein
MDNLDETGAVGAGDLGFSAFPALVRHSIGPLAGEVLAVASHGVGEML